VLYTQDLLDVTGQASEIPQPPVRQSSGFGGIMHEHEVREAEPDKGALRTVDASLRWGEGST